MDHLWRTHCKPVKSPLPPAVLTIMEHRHDKWLFSGFYSLDIQSFSIVLILGLPEPSKTHFYSSFCCPLYIFPPLISLFFFKCSFHSRILCDPDGGKGPQSAHPLSCLSSLILPNYVTQMEKSSYLCLSGQSLVIRDTQFTDLNVQFLRLFKSLFSYFIEKLLCWCLE